MKLKEAQGNCRQEAARTRARTPRLRNSTFGAPPPTPGSFKKVEWEWDNERIVYRTLQDPTQPRLLEWKGALRARADTLRGHQMAKAARRPGEKGSRVLARNLRRDSKAKAKALRPCAERCGEPKRLPSTPASPRVKAKLLESACSGVRDLAARTREKGCAWPTSRPMENEWL
ncbi:uncharacterized protein LOC144612836 [Panthera onca]